MKHVPVPAITLIGLLAPGWVNAGGAGAQQYNPADPIPPDPEVTTGTLANGLTYFIHENDEPENRAELRLVVNAGSILEDDDQLGLAHFVEHMAFNGTENFEKLELVNYLESIGMRFGPDINAYTSFDETVYMLQVPMDDPEVLATAFQILVDWAGGVVFDPEEVDKERGVVIEEWRGRRGGSARVQDEQFPVIFHGSRYAERLPIGDPDILANAPADRLRSFYEDWYRPDLMAVIAVGDFDGEAIEAMIRAGFSGLRGPANPRPRARAEVPVDHPPLISIATDPEFPAAQVQVLYKQAESSRGAVADFRRARVRSLYARMLNERLTELRYEADPPFADALASVANLARGADAVEFSAVVASDGYMRALDAVLTEIERVARHGFTAVELEREKASLRRLYEGHLAEADNRVFCVAGEPVRRRVPERKLLSERRDRNGAAGRCAARDHVGRNQRARAGLAGRAGAGDPGRRAGKSGVRCPGRGGRERCLRRRRHEGDRALRGGRPRCPSPSPGPRRLAGRHRGVRRRDRRHDLGTCERRAGRAQAHRLPGRPDPVPRHEPRWYVARA
ncbi:MAG: insulinase family protein [Gemmatimonadetes bacterium]|nr:insulinase family protein [Gemmatimonadota bacterium]MYE93584.1 insulinase family protein [Gemmatimonadota bacterium]MYJ10844.1 insulinase family protein [Gemmatimonadota bacterium]